VIGLLVALLWTSFALLAWTHVVYPLVVEALARIGRRPIRAGGALPRVTIIIASHNEETVIERRVENLLGLDYPAELVRIVVASDASTDRTDELVDAIAAREPRVTLLRAPRGGKVAAQNLAVAQADSEIAAFSDANAVWAAPALRKLVRNFADEDVAYVCGQLRIESGDGRNKEGTYWRYEMRLRQSESALGSVTGGNGSIYALRRADYVEVDPRFGHDLALPYRLARQGRRAVYEPEAIAMEKATPTNEDEYRRKVRMFEHCWLIVGRGKMLRHQRPGYLVALLSHRHLRYASGVLHLVLLAANVGIVALGGGWIYWVALAGQLALLAAALAGVGIARYYVLVTWATVVALWRSLRHGVSPVWEKAEGTR
jgi:cellulose synthase/poly-beta-1,6-N-acetylglucosamine synthase-like glycosyltransferase